MANTPTQAARDGRKLKRLSLASGAVFNTVSTGGGVRIRTDVCYAEHRSS